jgi:hypothetical protein
MAGHTSFGAFATINIATKEENMPCHTIPV